VPRECRGVCVGVCHAAQGPPTVCVKVCHACWWAGPCAAFWRDPPSRKGLSAPARVLCRVASVPGGPAWRVLCRVPRRPQRGWVPSDSGGLAREGISDKARAAISDDSLERARPRAKGLKEAEASPGLLDPSLPSLYGAQSRLAQQSRGTAVTWYRCWTRPWRGSPGLQDPLDRGMS
jgi:hypothetical protein